MRKPRKKTKADFNMWLGLIVKIVWNDPLHCEEITEKELEKQPDIVFRSYGEIIGKTNRNITVANTIGNEPRDRTLREVTRIPTSLIRSIVLLIPNEQEVLTI